MSDEITEARALIERLAAIRVQLSPADVRFLDSWQGYLSNAGAAARIGRWRLHNLRNVAACYGLADAPERSAVEAAELPSGYGLD